MHHRTHVHRHASTMHCLIHGISLELSHSQLHGAGFHGQMHSNKRIHFIESIMHACGHKISPDMMAHLEYASHK